VNAKRGYGLLPSRPAPLLDVLIADYICVVGPWHSRAPLIDYPLASLSNDVITFVSSGIL
jgi:hypothetical protein